MRNLAWTEFTPASLLLGDLVVAPSEDGVGSILICAGPQKLIGWHDLADGMAVIDIQFDQLDGAWRA